MKAANAFLKLDAAGLSLCTQGSRLVVEPAALLTAELRALTEKHRRDLLALTREAEERAAVVVAGARWGRHLHPAGGDA